MRVFLCVCLSVFYAGMAFMMMRATTAASVLAIYKVAYAFGEDVLKDSACEKRRKQFSKVSLIFLSAEAF